MANKQKVIWDRTNSMHDDVTNIYESAVDGDNLQAIQHVEALQEKLKEFKKNLKEEDE